MAKLKLVTVPDGLHLKWEEILGVAGLPCDTKHVRVVRPWNQNIIGFWLSHYSFEDRPDYECWAPIVLTWEKVKVYREKK